jgi:16S rRNA G966 N2-methylase RsmD
LPSLEENVKRLCDGRTRVVRDESLRFLKKKVVTGPYGIIFADPPFRKNLRRQRAQGRSAAGDWRQRRQAGAHGLGTEDLGLPPDRGWLHLLIEGIEEGQLLSQGGLFILESDKDDRESLPSGWSAVKEKLYGGCRLQFLRKAERNG